MQIFEMMNPQLKRRLKRFFTALIILYVIGGVALYLFQDLILFHPKPLSKDYQFSFNQPFEEVNTSFQDKNLSIVKFKPSQNRKGIVLFYHGNMENVEHYKQYPSFFLRNNYEIWMIDYPGFGKSTGKRTEKLMNEEALFMYDVASKEIDGDSIIVYGKSIGTGVASYVASVKNCQRLVLETPYYSIPSLAKHYFPIYPVNWMIRYSFPIYSYIKKVKAPVTIFHGTGDEVIPYKQSKFLKEKNEMLELITIEGGKHNNLWAFPGFQTKLDSLLK